MGRERVRDGDPSFMTRHPTHQLPPTLLDDPKIHAHDATTIADQTGYISKEDLTDKQMAKVQAAVSLDLELYEYAQKMFDAYPVRRGLLVVLTIEPGHTHPPWAQGVVASEGHSSNVLHLTFASIMI